MTIQTGQDQEIELGKDKITKNQSRLRAVILVQWLRRASIESVVVGSIPRSDADELYICAVSDKDSGLWSFWMKMKSEIHFI